MRYLIAAVLLVSAAGCVTSPVSPSTDVRGTWVTTTTTALGDETLTFTIAQDGPTISGTWSAVFATAPSASQTGRLSGTAGLGTISLTLTPDVQPSCPYTFRSTQLTATTMPGQLTTLNCVPVSSEGIVLTRQ